MLLLTKVYIQAVRHLCIILSLYKFYLILPFYTDENEAYNGYLHKHRVESRELEILSLK